jgi:hypothetical protein
MAHIPDKELEAEHERFTLLADNYERELKRRYDLHPTMCRRCKKAISFAEAQQQEGMPYHVECEGQEEEEMEKKLNDLNEGLRNEEGL